MKKSNKTTKTNISLNIKTVAVLIIILFASFIAYRLLLEKPLVAGVLDDYQYNTQKVVVTKDPKTGDSKYTVIQQRAGTGTVGVDVKSDLEVAQNGAKLVREKAIEKAEDEGKSQEEAQAIGNQAAQNSIRTSVVQIASGIASQQALKNGLSEEERAAKAAAAYATAEKMVANIAKNQNNALSNPTQTPGAVQGGGSSCGGKEAGIGDKQWAMLGDGTNKCVQCGGSRADGKGGPGVWGDQQVECGQGAAANYVAPIYQADKPKACWKNGVWYADTAGSVGDEKCLNGEWKNREDYIIAKQKECADKGQGYFYHEDHNACEKTTATTASGNPLVCGYGYEIKNNSCVPTVVAGSIAGLERECEKKAGMEYNRSNGLCEKSKVPLTAEQLKQVEIDKCKDLQKATNKAGSTTWVSCSDEGQPAYQNCVGKGFNADGTSSCNLKPVEFGNNSSVASQVSSTLITASTGFMAGPAGAPTLASFFVGGLGEAVLSYLGITPEEQVTTVVNASLGAGSQNPEVVSGALSGAVGLPTTVGTLTGAGAPLVTNVISKAADAPDAGYVDNVVGIGTGFSTAAAMWPVCISTGLINPVLVPLCEAASFTGGALFGSKATDVVVNMLDN